MYSQAAPPAVPNLEDAANFLTTWLRQPRRRDRTVYGYEIWLPSAVEDYARSAGGVPPQDQIPPHWIEALSEPFYAAAWDLCRLGVLRPGTRFQGAQAVGDGDGYCITPRGREWLAKQDAVPFIPTDPGRVASLLSDAGATFGAVYRTRAVEAALCYSAGAYYACCAMAGAAAESVALAVGIKKLGEEEASKLYFGKSGRAKLEEAVLRGVPAWLARDFHGHADLIAYWRDLSAHADERIVSEGEAYMALLGLLRFAKLASDNWEQLTAKK